MITQKRKTMIIIAYGGGTDSTALIIECKNRGIKIDYILFADTGGEKPHTYQYVKTFNEWLKKNGMPEIITVQKAGNGETLEENCLRCKTLPSIAYGYKTCSQKYKIQPQDKFFNNLPEAKAIWKSGGKLTKFIGYDATETHRIAKSKLSQNEKYENVYPLHEWGLTRKDCIKIIEDAGLCQPGKSACYFCPMSRRSEIMSLNHNYPELMQRAIDMEANADLTTIKGLGINFKWADVINNTDLFEDEFDMLPEMICECFEP